jgi:hypothetical protein
MQTRAFPCSLFPACWPASQTMFCLVLCFWRGPPKKNPKTISFVSAVGAKNTENENAWMQAFPP